MNKTPYLIVFKGNINEVEFNYNYYTELEKKDKRTLKELEEFASKKIGLAMIITNIIKLEK